MKKLIFVLFVYTLGISNILAQDSHGIAWKSWSELEEAYNQKPKAVILFFDAEWCAYCKKIEREVFTEQKVIDEVNVDYYAVRMDVETKDTITFNNKKFVNSQSLTQRNGVHEISLLLASRDGTPFSLPATIILNERFGIKKRVFQYYTSKQLLEML